jgi:tetratricopeptide (TPR) repeat protein
MAIKEPRNPASRREPEYIDKPSPFSIEGIRSGAVQSRVVKTMIVLSGIIMAGGTFLLSNQPSGIPTAGRNTQQLASTIATVGSQNITGSQLEDTFNRYEQFNAQIGQKTTASSYLGARQNALKTLTNQAALVEAAQKANVQVSDAEISAEIDKQLRQEFKPKRGQTEAQFLRLVQSQLKVSSLEEAIAQQRDKLPPEAREQIRQKLLVDKLGQQTKDATVSTEDDYKRSVTKLDLYQILVRPELPKGNSKDFQGDVARMSSLARDKAVKLLAGLKANPTLANFKAVALKESGDLQTKSKGGSLGLKLPSQLPNPELGEQLSRSAQNLVGPIETSADVPGTQAIYFINARKTELPKDYDKNKTKLLADFQKAQGEAAWQKKQTELQKAVTPQISDPAMVGYQLQSDLYTKQGTEQTTTRDEALARYDIALKNAPTGLEVAAINYQKSLLFRDQGKIPQQLDALKAAASAQKNDAAMQLAYAQALQVGGQPKAALEAFKTTSKTLDDNPSAPSMFGGNPDDTIRTQVAGAFALLKEPKLAAAERAKIKPAAPGGMGGMPPGVNIQPAPR